MAEFLGWERVSEVFDPELRSEVGPFPGSSEEKALQIDLQMFILHYIP